MSIGGKGAGFSDEIETKRMMKEKEGQEWW